MRANLFFLGVLVRHLGPNHPPGALANALREIHRAAGHRPNSPAWRQFLCFLRAVLGHVIAVQTGSQRGVVTPAPLGEGLHAPRAGRGTFRKRRSRVSGVGLELYRDGLMVLEVPGRGPVSCILRDAVPGHYVLALANGRVIWQAHLEETELVWRRAFPGRPLGMAADSGLGRPAAQCSLEASLMGGAVVLRIYPGPERGIAEVHVFGAGGGVRHGS